MKVVDTFFRPGEIEFFLRLHGLWERIIDIPLPPDPPFDIETFEPIEPPWQAIREWIPADDGERASIFAPFRPVLRLATQEVHRPNRGDAPPTFSRSRQPRSRVAGRRQGLRRRFLFHSILKRGVVNDRRVSPRTDPVRLPDIY
jgi:hypothetical protein